VEEVEIHPSPCLELSDLQMQIKLVIYRKLTKLAMEMLKHDQCTRKIQNTARLTTCRFDESSLVN